MRESGVARRPQVQEAVGAALLVLVFAAIVLGEQHTDALQGPPARLPHSTKSFLPSLKLVAFRGAPN